MLSKTGRCTPARGPSAPSLTVKPPLPIPGALQVLTRIRLGHAGHETVDFACEQLPAIVRNNLAACLSHPDVDPLSNVPDVLRQSIASFDELIAADLLHLFPDPQALKRFSDSDLRSIINDKGRNSAAIYRCMSGSTVLLSLLDPARSHLWVATLGDSQAGASPCRPRLPRPDINNTVLGYKLADGSLRTKLLSSFHNGYEKAEVNRIREEHPGESECILHDRVLGAIAVTRGMSSNHYFTVIDPLSRATAVGDFIFKLPRDYADRVFKNTELGFNLSSRPEEFLKRNLTPPYLSNRAHVVHVDLSTLQATDAHMIMCSDGLLDIYDDKGFDLDDMIPVWSDIVVSGKQRDAKQNLALLLLRESIGGQDLEKISQTMTVDLDFRWMDDTTILVQRL